MRFSTIHHSRSFASIGPVHGTFAAYQAVQRTPIRIWSQSRLFRSSTRLAGNDSSNARDYEQIGSKGVNPEQHDQGESAPKTKRCDTENEKPREEGDKAMSRRLSSMTEQALMEGGNSTLRDFESAGFSPDLKARLEEKILKDGQDTSFKMDNARAFSLANMPVRASVVGFDIPPSLLTTWISQPKV